MANKPIKIFSKQIKTNANKNHNGYYLTHIRMPARIRTKKKEKRTKCCLECGRIGTLVHYWKKREIVWPFSKIFKTELPYNSAIPLLVISGEEKLFLCPLGLLSGNLWVKLTEERLTGEKAYNFN